MTAKKKVQKHLLVRAAKVSKRTAGILANIPCIWWDYQPKKPKAVKKMRKF